MDDFEYGDDPGPNREGGRPFRGRAKPEVRGHNPQQRPSGQMYHVNRAQHHFQREEYMRNDGRPDGERRRIRSPSGSSDQRNNGRKRSYHSVYDNRTANQNSDDHGPRRKIPRKQFLGFNRLEEISNTEPKDTLATLMESKAAFLEMIQSRIEKFDMFVIIMKIIAKVCQSSFDETKSRLLLDICNSNFTVSLKTYLTDLPWPESKMSNDMYWKKPESFWGDFLEFYDCIVTTSPTLALRNRSLLEGASAACLNNLKERHGFEMPQDFNLKLVELRERLADFEKSNEGNSISRKHMIGHKGAPPEDFRELSILPTSEDLLHHKPFCRPNIVNGHYEDVEHYLDVQFRLLREDCFGPLRDGLSQFLKDQTKRRYDNIRVFWNVKFAKPYVSQTKLGSLVQIDVTSNKMFKRTNWAHNKRFIYGSLVLFTKDNCKSFIVAVILDREEHFLVQGLFLKDQTKRRYDNIRVFWNVKFAKPYVSQTKLGSLVQIDVTSNKMFKRTNWAHNKRFIYGSLVLFTKDNCKSFIVAVILDREEHFLVQGLIPVNIIGQEFNLNLYNDDTYTMIESEVYFEPYYHVLKVLQDPTFPQHLSMKQYIVDVKPEPHPPSYLDVDTKFTIETKYTKKTRIDGDCCVVDLMENRDIEDEKKRRCFDGVDGIQFNVLQDESWPKIDALPFNDSQYEAFKLSLCHEFAVVQGPPGTGKTYLGIKVAKAFIENLDHLEGCLMLVICYTNHALDQFLDALLEVSKDIVRIGGQSRNEAMKDISLNKLRTTVSIRNGAKNAFFGQKLNLKHSIRNFQMALVRLDVFLNGVVKPEIIILIEEVKYLTAYYERANLNDDPLFYWLFEHYADFYKYDISELLEETTTDGSFAKLEKENRKRTGVFLDDQENNNDESEAYRKSFSSISLDSLTAKIKELVTQYKAATYLQAQKNIERELQILNAYRTTLNEMSKHRDKRVNIKITRYTDFARIDSVDRWALYFSWIQNRVLEARQEVGKRQEQVNNATAIYEEARMMLDMQVLKNTRIVGMTTSGAARMRKLLQTLNPPIVIVEEAAEVLEQHIITSLTERCKHLILIGDHQQLRPAASHMKLAKHFNLEVSLFERMINNGIHSRRLSVQHRMRPEIAALICPHIYPELINHPSVYDFPDVKGMAKNLFFYTHNFKEEAVEENMSRTNHKEADMLLGLAHYLMQQGYQPEDVTILAAYKGQMFYLRKQSDNYPYLKNVKITVVDNYQGEESKIILLSLVRNNDENKIGFLGTPNRICVALSRAKYGFYIFGNIDTLKASSELWKNIAGTLEAGDFIGNKLTLQCQNHTNNQTIIEKVEDFQNVPEGGCLLLCEKNFSKCGHKCLLRCHGYDREHNTNSTRCTRKCERVCVLQHLCPKKCAEECGPCKRTVTKQLPCGHELIIPCFMEPDDPKVKCCIMVDVILPDCKHQTKKLCHENIKKVRCEVNCEFRVEKCGHSCRRKCHVNDDPNHEEYMCMKQCAKANMNCKANLDGDRGDHQCQKKCHEICDFCSVKSVKRRANCKHWFRGPCHVDPDSVACMKKCTRSLPCGHPCKKICNESCGDCKEMVPKIIPGCSHEMIVECMIEPIKSLCAANCERTMSCGHKCKGVCGNECRPQDCIELSPGKVSSPCGHLVSLPCNIASLPADAIKPEMVLAACTAACYVQLECKHVCQGTCAGCRRGRLHVACRQPCNQDNVCSHKCTDPCNQTCPPCRKKCEIRCEHNKCNKKCGEPCTPCQENCGRVCPHLGGCTKRCGETCSRPPCNEPCPRKLPCKHSCRGLCGEDCPPFCKLCKPGTFPVDFFGDPFDDTDRLVLLKDCGHVMEVESMDNLMMSERDCVKIPCCPYIDPVVCRKPIVNTGRYKDLITSIYRKEINPIKEKVFGTTENIKATNHKLSADMVSYAAKYVTVLKDNKDLKKHFLRLKLVVLAQKKVSKLQLDMELVCLDILDMISEVYVSYLKSHTTALKDEFSAQVQLICKIFEFKNNELSKISMQQRNDVKLEIQRLNAIVQLAKLLSHEAYTQLMTNPLVSKAYETAKASVFNNFIFNKDEAMDVLEKLQEEIKVSGVVTKQERDLVVQAIGLKAGHWYKCPNGHYYCIGECGGAMQVGKCAECGARIGGGSHALLADNRHAPEMDGSRFAAWSEQYNNMANFDIRD